MPKVRVNPDSAGSGGTPAGRCSMVLDARIVVTTALPIALPVEREIELMPLAIPLWWCGTLAMMTAGMAA